MAMGEREGVLRFIPERGSVLAETALSQFIGATFRISPKSNRVGYRLEGAPLEGTGFGQLLSEPIAPGTIQVPADGNPILLMADRQTTGGYPRIGHVITADLPKAAQLWLGDSVRFEQATLDEARAALLAQEALLKEDWR
jgi:antagonist of KipI